MTEVLTTGAEVIFRVKYVTLKMASAQVVKRQLPITVNSQDSSHPDDHFQSGYIYYSWVQTIFLYIGSTVSANILN